MKDLDILASDKEALLVTEMLNKLRIDHEELFNTNYETKILNTLIAKICNTCFSIYTIYNSNNINNINGFKDINSLYILSRAVIENYLTIEYLFFNKCNEEERKFRFRLWALSGILSRHKDHKNAPKEYQELITKEKKEFEILKKELYQFEHFKKLKPNKQHKLREQLNLYGSSRNNLSWYNLIKASNIHESLFQIHYNLSSNYAHSEYHAISQLIKLETDKNTEDYELLAKPLLSILLKINSKLFTLTIKHLDLEHLDLEIYKHFDLIKYYEEIYNKT